VKALLDLVTRRRVDTALARADTLAASGRTDDALQALRDLSIRDFGEALLDVSYRFPALKASLPEMPSPKIQQDWTGSAGRALLLQTAAFVRSMEAAFVKRCGRPLAGAVILDYGCGWGRILRLMYRYSVPSTIYGVDPWEASLEICRATRVLGNLARCDDVPRDLPFGAVQFDLVYAFSIFTHLSERTATAVLGAIRRRIREDGLLVLTVRPVEYWGVQAWFPPGTDARTMHTLHAEKGFAFIPHQREPIAGDITFGDTSISLDYVRRHWTEWHLAGHETNRIDPYQLILFLRSR
jgi:Methyltransferase domain